MHYRKLFESEYVGAWDLTDDQDRPVDKVVTIVEVKKKEIKSQRGSEIKPVLFFKNTKKGMVCNVTNAQRIANMHGNDVEDWVGKRITLYQTTTSTKDGDVPCIRVRPEAPKGADAKNGKKGKEREREPGTDDE